MVPIDAILGAVAGAGAIAGAVLTKLLEGIGRFLCGIRVTYEPF